MSSETLLTPKDLADAIGVSESSVRRWVDAGAVQMTRTAGGHRRITLPEAVRFIRSSGATVVRPEIVGLRGLRRRLATGRHQEGADELFEALRDGRTAVAYGLLAGWYLGGRSLTDIFDGPVRLAMGNIGELWQHEPAGILQEHQASLICVEAIIRLRELLPVSPASSPSAIGGAPEGDFYLLPTLLAATTLRETGYRERNFGANTPLSLLAEAARDERARLVWVSISAELDGALKQQLADLAKQLEPPGVDLVIGGRLAGHHVPLAANVRHMSSMAELAAFATARREQAGR